MSKKQRGTGQGASAIGFKSTVDNLIMNELYLGTDYKVSKPYLSNPLNTGEGRVPKNTLCVSLQYTKRNTEKNKVGLILGNVVLCQMPLEIFLRYNNLHHREDALSVIRALRVEIADYTRDLKKEIAHKLEELEESIEAADWPKNKAQAVMACISTHEKQAAPADVKTARHMYLREGRAKNDKRDGQHYQLEIQTQLKEEMADYKRQMQRTQSKLHTFDNLCESLRYSTKQIPNPTPLGRCKCAGRVLELYQRCLKGFDSYKGKLRYGKIYPQTLIAPRYFTSPGQYQCSRSNGIVFFKDAINLEGMGFGNILKFLTKAQSDLAKVSAPRGSNEARNELNQLSNLIDASANSNPVVASTEGGYVFKQPESILATLNAQLCGNTVFRERFTTLLATALWRGKTVPELLEDYERNNIELQGHFVFDNNRKYKQFKRLLRYDFKEHVIHTKWDKEDKPVPEGSYPVEEGRPESLLLMVHNLITKMDEKGPFILSLSYGGKGGKFIQTTVIKVQSRANKDANVVISIENLDGHRDFEYTPEALAELRRSHVFIPEKLFNTLKRHGLDAVVQAEKLRLRKDKEEQKNKREQKADSKKVAVEDDKKEEQKPEKPEKKAKKSAEKKKPDNKDDAQALEGEQEAPERKRGRRPWDDIEDSPEKPSSSQAKGKSKDSQDSMQWFLSAGHYTHCDIFTLEDCASDYLSDPRQYAIQQLIAIFHGIPKFDQTITEKLIKLIIEMADCTTPEVITSAYDEIEKARVKFGVMDVPDYKRPQLANDKVDLRDLALDRLLTAIVTLKIAPETMKIYNYLSDCLQAFDLLSPKGGLSLKRQGYGRLLDLYYGLIWVTTAQKEHRRDQQEVLDDCKEKNSILPQTYRGATDLYKIMDLDHQCHDFVLGLVQAIIVHSIMKRTFQDTFNSTIRNAYLMYKKIHQDYCLDLLGERVQREKVCEVIEGTLKRKKVGVLEQLKAIDDVKNIFELSAEDAMYIDAFKSQHQTYFDYTDLQGKASASTRVHFSMGDLFSDFTLLSLCHRASEHASKIKHVHVASSAFINHAAILDYPKTLKEIKADGGSVICMSWGHDGIIRKLFDPATKSEEARLDNYTGVEIEACLKKYHVLYVPAELAAVGNPSGRQNVFEAEFIKKSIIELIERIILRERKEQRLEEERRQREASIKSPAKEEAHKRRNSKGQFVEGVPRPINPPKAAQEQYKGPAEVKPSENIGMLPRGKVNENDFNNYAKDNGFDGAVAFFNSKGFDTSSMVRPQESQQLPLQMKQTIAVLPPSLVEFGVMVLRKGFQETLVHLEAIGVDIENLPYEIPDKLRQVCAPKPPAEPTEVEAETMEVQPPPLGSETAPIVVEDQVDVGEGNKEDVVMKEEDPGVNREQQNPDNSKGDDQDPDEQHHGAVEQQLREQEQSRGRNTENLGHGNSAQDSELLPPDLQQHEDDDDGKPVAARVKARKIDWQLEARVQKRHLGAGDLIEIHDNAAMHFNNPDEMLSPSAQKSTCDANSESDWDNTSVLGFHDKTRAKCKVPGDETFYRYNDPRFKCARKRSIDAGHSQSIFETLGIDTGDAKAGQEEHPPDEGGAGQQQ